MALSTLWGIGFSLLLLAVTPLMAAATPREKPTPPRDTASDTWAATDGLGRTLPGSKECGPPRKDKFVGVFYFLWMDKQHDPGTLYDNSRLLAANPANPQYGPEHAFHWWGQPRLGYYLSNDEFVIRKHAQALTDAGVDMIAFDVTNDITYDENFLTICRVFTDIRKTGRTTPQITFLANSNSPRVVTHLYETFYRKNLSPDLWFRWKGKPLMMASTEGLSAEVKAFFTFRQSWAWSDPRGWFGDGKDKWPWVENYPQKPGWHESPDKPEQIAVCTAQHATSNIGRSFHNGKQPPPDQIAPEQGLCFIEQWKRALEVDPEMVFITGWNEWVAMRFLSPGGQPFLGKPLKAGETFFVDQYNQEFSRDIEPMQGGHGDAYYYQMVSYIRRFKGVRATPKPSAPQTIRLDKSFRAWAKVQPTYRDDLGDTAHRNHPGWGKTGPYINRSGRNDFDTMKVARDSQSLTFYVRTREPITAPEGTRWMWLLLDTDNNPKTGWEGFDFLINRTRPGEGRCSVERSLGGDWKWETVGEARFVVVGNEMQLAIPRALLGLAPEKGPLHFGFKWADNVPESGDILDCFDQGDVAPNGRFVYRYEETP